ncbi:MAG: thioredoxin domain-containing protein [Candidatus Micrarchaeota archaeon]|nr:thioredoxin domain-containing protein [Candidatus Micrarchaeota archaeon]
MTEKADKAVRGLEQGEYVIGIAIILAALLVSATIYIGSSGIQEAIGKVKLTAPSAPSGGSQAQPSPQAQPQPEPKQGSPKVSGLDYSNSYFKGKADAKVVLVEYSDFECPFCNRVNPTLAQLKKSYPEAKYVFRHFPLPFHPNAQKAAEAAECAGEQGKFFEMHDAMFAEQNKLSVPDLKAKAAAIGLDTAKFNSCLDSGKMASAVQSQMDEGESIGIRGTPGFLAYSTKDRSEALQSRLSTIASKLSGLGVDASVVEVEGAGFGIVFAGALPYSNFDEVMKAFN